MTITNFGVTYYSEDEIKKLKEKAKNWDNHDKEYCDLKEWREENKKNKEIVQKVREVIDECLEEYGFRYEPEIAMVKIQNIVKLKEIIGEP